MCIDVGNSIILMKTSLEYGYNIVTSKGELEMIAIKGYWHVYGYYKGN